MTKLKKQPKITKMFRKAAPAVKTNDLHPVAAEVQQLQQRLSERQTELFQLQRISLKRKVSLPKNKDHTFVRPQKMKLLTSVEYLQHHLQIFRMVTGTEVTAYHAGDYCCVVFRMQNTHGLKIQMTRRPGENQIVSSDLPLGFNLNAVLEDFDSVMTPECLGAIRKALVAYYDRLEQYQSLKKIAQTEAQVFKTLDGSYVQIAMSLTNDDEDLEQRVQVVLMLDYRVYDIRPKTYAIRDEDDLPEGAADVLRAKCAVFKKKPLDVAFEEAFLSDIGPYQMTEQARCPSPPRPRARNRRPRPYRHTQNDDTFHPDECSDQSEDDI